jgi:hypothetical protein
VTPSSKPISSTIFPFSIRSTVVPVNRILRPVRSVSSRRSYIENGPGQEALRLDSETAVWQCRTFRLLPNAPHRSTAVHHLTLSRLGADLMIYGFVFGSSEQLHMQSQRQ